MNSKGMIKFYVNSTAGERLTDIIKSIIQAELAGKMVHQVQEIPGEEVKPAIDTNIDAMLDHLDAWK
jgi:hypothetical protein